MFEYLGVPVLGLITHAENSLSAPVLSLNALLTTAAVLQKINQIPSPVAVYRQAAPTEINVRDLSHYSESSKFTLAASYATLMCIQLFIIRVTRPVMAK